MNQNLNNDLLDIINGYSEIEGKGSTPFFYQHLTIKESLELERIYEKRLKSAILAGVKTEAELLNQAICFGKWSKAEEESLTSLQWEATKLQQATDKIQDPFQKKSANAAVEEKKKQIKDLETKRASLCAESAERLADYARLKFVLSEKCFLDPECAKKCEKALDTSLLNCLLFRLNDCDHLLEIAFSPQVFELYGLHRKNISLVFNKSGFNMTIYQKNILSLCAILMSKLENYGEEMDESKKDDPIYIFKYKPKKEGGEKNAKTSDHNDLRRKARRGENITPEDLLT